MTKDEFIEQYLDRYEQEHPTEKIDYDALREQADCAWYDKEVDQDHATEYDLSPEKQKEVKEVCKGMARAVNAYGKKVKRTRKQDPDKQAIISAVADALRAMGYAVTVSNPERTIDFSEYSITLTKHRPKKS